MYGENATLKAFRATDCCVRGARVTFIVKFATNNNNNNDDDDDDDNNNRTDGWQDGWMMA